MSLYLKAKTLVCLLTCYVAIAWLPVQAANGNDGVRAQHVLILSSYHRGYSWTEDIIGGVRKILDDYDKPFELSYEYLDTKRYEESPLY